MITATLRVNIKSLAAESIIIRKEIRKYKDQPTKNSLHEHRVLGLRKEARHAQLCYAAVRGIPYSKIERNAKTEPNWKRIFDKLTRHTKDESLIEKVCDWCEEAKKQWKS